MIYVKIMQNVNNKTRINVKGVCEETGSFTVKVCAHREFSLSPYLFSFYG